MKHVKTTMIASAIALACGAGNVLADSWTIVQEATLSNATTLTQTTTTDGGIQAINNINLNMSDGTVKDDSSQTVTTSTNNLTLTQDDGTKNSRQAINRVSAYQIGDGTGTAFSQEIVTTGTIKLGQNGVGNDNFQAGNYAVAKEITGLTQKFTGASTLTLEQGVTASIGTGNVQAGNLIDGSNATLTGIVTQDINVSAIDMDQNGTGANVQAGNALITASGATDGAITQTLTAAATFDMDQTTANGSIQSGNYVGDKL
jgi:hypothetical protein